MKIIQPSIAILIGLACCNVGAAAEPTPAEVVANVVAAADVLLNELDGRQRAAVMFDFDDQEQRRRWSNLPVTMAERRGLLMADLTEGQKSAVMGLIGATLSKRGLQQVIDNMNGDELLAAEGGRARTMFGKDLYYISLLGKPSVETPWMWQYGGHHLAINATISGDQITLSPSLTGGQPVDFELDGRKVRQLAGDEDAAFALIESLNEGQLRKAVLGDDHVNLAYGPGAEDTMPKQEGIRGAELNTEQQALLVKLIEERIGILNATHAKIAMAQIKRGIADAYFSWYGPTDRGAAATYRIQGPRVLIEYSPQHLGGDDTQHTHAMYRDPKNDYGAAITPEKQ